jgi:UDP:flavonoid glycosyltransferase YjiC (YdhE family)
VVSRLLILLDVCGFFFRDPPQYTPPQELADFLKAGSSPIYIGFGSIVTENAKEISAMLLEAVKIIGVRAIISRGWSDLSGDEDESIFWVQQVAAVIHHGGAGTTACGLLNGRPTAIIPFFGE